MSETNEKWSNLEETARISRCNERYHKKLDKKNRYSCS